MSLGETSPGELVSVMFVGYHGELGTSVVREAICGYCGGMHGVSHQVRSCGEIVNYVCTESKLGGKFYAVRRGTRPRIYNSWRACEKVVSYSSGAEFKRFRMYKEACGFMEGEGVAIVSK